MELLEQFRGVLAGAALADARGLGQLNCVARSYRDYRGFSAEDLTERMLGWFRASGEQPDAMTRESMQLLGRGYTFERAAADARMAVPERFRTNDRALLRTLPAGLVRYHDDIHLIGEARLICGLTHADEECKMASVAINLALAHLLMVGTDGLIEEISEFVAPRMPEFGKQITSIEAINPAELRLSGRALDTAQAALWFAYYCDSYRELQRVIDMGEGDADVLLPLASALIGAHLGYSGLADGNWPAALSVEYMLQLADQLYELSQSEPEIERERS
ncbi:ADP-ribosylglycohydrolase family protein [bacterium]|nr:ADP-ribosylglycohydrolase family protein [bacterium]UNM07455.1 MAG: ADP-ribosylglycohydrolase family protein [Planctomycetales bacterium]